MVAIWSDIDEMQEPLGSLPAAGRLALYLARRGVTTTTAGQLVRVVLPPDATDADLAIRCLLAEVEVPVAIALARPREPVLDDLLAGSDRVLVAGGRGAPAGLVTATLTGIGRIAPGCAELDAHVGAAARSTLALGLTVPPRLRSRVEEALR
jgi:hypothetical protein